MVKAIKKRFADRAGHLIRGHDDFTHRRRNVDAQIFAFVCAVGGVLLGIGLVIYSKFLSVAERKVLSMLICVLMGFTMYVLSKKYKSLYDSMEASEFMSAILVSAIGMHVKFYLLATPDSEIIYLNGTFQRMFPDLAQQSEWDLPGFFDLYNISAETRRRILEAVTNSKSDMVELSVEGADKKMQTFQLSIEPIPRPKGIILLQAM